MQLGKSLMIAGPTYNPFDSKAIKRAIYGFGIPKLYRKQTFTLKYIIFIFYED
jgi:hypothetical protein